MKQSKYILFALSLLFSSKNLMAQTLNLHNLENTKHIAHASFGLDYSVAYSLGYAYKLESKMPIVLNANFSKPAGETFLDDFKTKLGAQFLLLNHNSFKGAVIFNGIYRKFDSELVQLQNFGSELKGNIGFYKKHWFIAADLGFDKAIVTHFKHTEKYRNDIYSEVRDGWYEPATGGNINYGGQAGLSLGKFDLTLSFGKIIAQDFKSKPTLPLYFNLGLNLKLQ